jgi:uncharacterized membrane protein HdeD (DUF308 family)
MSIPNHEMVRRGVRRSVLVLLAGLGGLALPPPVARTGGLLILYALGALAVLSGVANAAQALRVRETARWLLPASVFAVILGLVALAAPASVGAALVRGLGGAVVVAGALMLLSTVSRERALQSLLGAGPPVARSRSELIG